MALVARGADPRQARGKHWAWPCRWGVMVTALLSQQRPPAASAQWAQRQATAVVAACKPARGRVPRASTIRRARQRVDGAALERQCTARAAPPVLAPPPATADDGQASAGNQGRGAAAPGLPTGLVRLVMQRDARGVAQTAVAQQWHARQAVPLLLTGRDMPGVVTALDAGLPQPKVATHILAQAGHALMVGKRNRQQLYHEPTWCCDPPPVPGGRPWRTVTTVNTGHGGRETRHLTGTDDFDDELPWPGVQHVLRREGERVALQTGAVSRAVTSASPRLAAGDARPEELAAWWRRGPAGCWAIDHQRQYVRDVRMGDAACQLQVGAAPPARAAVRNALISRLRKAGWRHSAAGVRHDSTSVPDAVPFIGVPSPGL